MRWGGFPCRYEQCVVLFGVVDKSSTKSLLEASARRTHHEETAHGYRHPPPPQQPEFRGYAPRIAKTKSKSE